MISYFLIICFIIFLDLSSKKYMTEYLKINSFQKITRYLYLSLAYNRGAFLGLLKNNQRLLKALIGITIIALIGLFTFELNNNGDPDLILSLSFIIGGAIGNYMDRVLHGYVTDFIYIKYKSLPIFNFADVFIFIGTILLIIGSI